MNQLNRKGNRRGMHGNQRYNQTSYTYKHGLRRHPLYSIWAGIRERCYSETCPSYPRYGGKGVKIYKEWDEFLPFYHYCLENGWWDGCHVSRHNDTGDYTPDNISFKTPEENIREMNLRHAVSIRCIETGEVFPSVSDAGKWIHSQGLSNGKLKTVVENIRSKGLKGSKSYGYTWEVMPNAT